jgi:hypothetical protein
MSYGGVSSTEALACGHASCMDEESERLQEDQQRQARTEVPVPVWCERLLVETDGAAAWTSNVRLYSSGVLFDVTTIWSPHLGGQEAVGAHGVEGADVGWIVSPEFTRQGPPVPILDDGLDHLVRVESDGSPVTHFEYGQSIRRETPLLMATDGVGSANVSAQSWWLSAIPAESLTVTLALPSVGVSGEVLWDATAWRELARSVGRI